MTSTKYLSMADNITKVTKLRNLAITHLIVGFLLFCFSVAEQVVVDYWTKVSYFGIWNGILMLITGCLGIGGTRREPSTSRKNLVCWFKGCSLINAIVSCSIVMLYIMAALFLFQAGSEHYDAEMAMVTMILILGVIEAVTAITVLGISCSSDPPRQVSTAAPVAVPRQRDTRFIARQTVSLESQDNQPQIVMSPNSREMDDPPPPYESVALGNQTVQFDLSRSYTSVAIPAGNGIVEFRTVTPGAHEEQTQIVQPPDSSSAVEDPPPPYEAVALGYQTVQFDLPPPFASVPIQAVDDNVEFQTVSSGAQGDQPQIVQPPGSLATENTPPYEDIASDHQAFTVDTLPPYDEAVNGNLTFNAQLC